MIDLIEIENTIEELENGKTTFDTCMKLSSLYIIRDKFIKDDVVKEYNDILPEYYSYRNLKKKFQLGEVNRQCVLTSLSNLCDEINEFISTLYSSIDIVEEQEILNNKLTKEDRL